MNCAITISPTLLCGPLSGSIQNTAPSSIINGTVSVQVVQTIPTEPIAPEGGSVPTVNQESNTELAFEEKSCWLTPPISAPNGAAT